ncbi:uncharacterized protein LOC131259867 [Anopheles coustani]|uniref:uncharacterized protein LOC131259867 n=1 Tax=Anopheles coustani TaxID=139045 RepID=UPI00265946E6|nr:uncharacterized protein LOC131259867 [Anopheles coustani]
MARLTLLVTLVVGLACLLGHSRATPLSSGAKDIANAPQIPNFPGPGEIPKPPGMLHSRVTRDVPQEFPKQDQFPPPPPPPEKPSTV